MPADSAIVNGIVEAIQLRGGQLLSAPALPAPNPFPLSFTLDGTEYKTLVYVRRITPQSGENTDHGRPEGEWHTQMLFDDSQRGAGIRNRLAVRRGYRTILLGYADIGGHTVLAAWDAGRKSEYSFSRSLQIREGTLAQAVNGGIAQQVVRGGEVVVAFRPEFLPEYLDGYDSLHGAIDPAPPPPESLDASTSPARQSSRQRRGSTPQRRDVQPPPDYFGPRERRAASGTRPVRDVRFKAFLADRYDGCAICGISAPPLLEAAHIIPVAHELSSDHPSNGLLLCRNCHRLFDNRFLLIAPDYSIEVAAIFHETAAADAARFTQPDRARLRLPSLEAEYLPDPEKLRLVYEGRLGPASAS